MPLKALMMKEPCINAENFTKMEELTTPWPNLLTALHAGWEKQTEIIMLALASGSLARNYTERTVGG